MRCNLGFCTLVTAELVCDYNPYLLTKLRSSVSFHHTRHRHGVCNPRGLWIIRGIEQCGNLGSTWILQGFSILAAALGDSRGMAFGQRNNSVHSCTMLLTVDAGIFRVLPCLQIGQANYAPFSTLQVALSCQRDVTSPEGNNHRRNESACLEVASSVIPCEQHLPCIFAIRGFHESYTSQAVVMPWPNRCCIHSG
ncbi:hypothetical protein CALVIDRAFT_34516 [Calocera viscosa TUFC12733]|uniref:Uncharacterized protein n=1 Tax=Calocera viscosa (strain TUFC12733) TaxID=1330018 RepID=A0A167FP51_CALVF|nr:hypothetical protein CALVIDRAFT_34516 [Calocera viscosa TUFC12733]